MIHDAQCAFQLRAVPGIPWHQHRSSLALQPVDCPGWPFGSVVDLLCTIKAGQNMDVHMRSARLQDLPGISPMFVVVHCSAMLCYGSYIYIYWLHVSTRRFDACFRAIPGSSVYRHVLRASTSARRTGLLRCRTMCTNGRPVVARDTATFRIPLLISMSLVQNTNQNSSAKKEPRLVAWWWFIFWTAPWSTIIN